MVDSNGNRVKGPNGGPEPEDDDLKTASKKIGDAAEGLSNLIEDLRKKIEDKEDDIDDAIDALDEIGNSLSRTYPHLVEGGGVSSRLYELESEVTQSNQVLSEILNEDEPEVSEPGEESGNGYPLWSLGASALAAAGGLSLLRKKT